MSMKKGDNLRILFTLAESRAKTYSSKSTYMYILSKKFHVIQEVDRDVNIIFCI